MGSYMDFKNFGNPAQPEGTGGKLAGNISLTRQPSVYSLTFDEFQNTLGGPGKDFGSMNMDELLKNIWTAEETQAMTSSACGGEGNVPSENLQRQGSLTLPRTINQKTVDEVWRDLFKENEGIKDGSCSRGSNVPPRQATLGETTLEEFLVRAGVVREDIEPIGRPNNGGFYGEISRADNNNVGWTFGFQQPTRNQGVLANQNTENNTVVSNLASSFTPNVGGVRSSQQQQLQQLPLFPRQSTVSFASPMNLVNNAQLATPGTRGLNIGMADPSINTALVQGTAMQSGANGMAGLATGVTKVAAGSPANQLCTDVITKSNMDESSLSPSPYVFNESVRGRKSNSSLEKVVERRRKRMIKNRESAARSRARKQAYTIELEAELAKLKEINQELQKKQEELMEMQKNQIFEKMNARGGKRQCLRRTLTGPW